MKTFVFLLTVFCFFSCQSPKSLSGKNIKGQLEDVWLTMEEGKEKAADYETQPHSDARITEEPVSYTLKSRSDYLEKDLEGVFYGNIYKIKQKKNRILLKRHGMAKPADLEIKE